MQGAVLYGPRDVRFEERETPTIIKPTDAIIRIAATCVCGSDLWPYRGISPVAEPTPMGHEYCGVVEEVGKAVTSIKPGQFVIGSFFASDNTCPHCHHGYQSSCEHREFVGGAQAPSAARSACRRHPGGDPGHSVRRSRTKSFGSLRRHGHRLVRGRRRQREAGHDSCGRRRWGGWPAGRACSEAERRRAYRRNEPSRIEAEPRPRVRRDRHRN